MTHNSAPRGIAARGAKFFTNRKQSALFYSVNRKNSAQLQGFTRFR